MMFNIGMFTVKAQCLSVMPCCSRLRAAEELTTQAQRSITWRSQQLTRGRDQGECGNSGERMHLEALLDLQRKEEKARPAGPTHGNLAAV